MSAPHINQIAVDVRKQVGFFGDKNGHNAVFDAVTNHGSGHATFADSGLVAHDNSLFFCLNVENSQRHRVNLLSG